jgi:hypothetical protein
MIKKSSNQMTVTTFFSQSMIENGRIVLTCNKSLPETAVIKAYVSGILIGTGKGPVRSGETLEVHCDY